jgi:hypothetical protein
MSTNKTVIPDNETMDIIIDVFSPKTVTHLYGNTIRINTNYDSCGLFDIFSDHISIERLDKCGSTSGTELLQMYDKLAERMPNIKYIKLYDASKIEICSNLISLYMIKILTTGQSWYNSQGYFSENHESEKLHNESKINMNYEEFIDIVYRKDFETFSRKNSIEQFTKELEKNKKTFDELNDKLKEKPFNEYDADEDDYNYSKKKITEYQYKIDHYYEIINSYIKEQEAEINIGIRLFPDVNKSVKDYFNYVLQDIKSNIEGKGCRDKETIEKCTWLSLFIDKIEKSSILHYYRDKLIKMVALKGGSKKSKSKKSKSKKSKSKNGKSKKRKSKSNVFSPK